MMESFHWLRPWWLTAVLLLVPFVWLRLHSTHQGSDWHRFCDPHLLPHLLQNSTSGKQGRIPYWLLLAALLIIVALAGPVWQRLPQPVFQKQSALILILDLSMSMDATDIKPSRLNRARLKIDDLLKRRREGTTALITFAGEAFMVTPLTSDTETITAHLQALTTDIMPAPGSHPESGITLAAQTFKQSGLSTGEAILITDSEVTASTLEAARQFHQQGHRLLVLGVGTLEGAPIPGRQGGFLQDNQGAIVIPRLHETDLQQLAAAGGGLYTRMQTDDRDLNLLLASRESPGFDEKAKSMDLTADVWHEEGPWLLLLVLPLAALGFRRGVLLFWLSIALFPQPAAALDWESLWKRPDQQAAEKLAAGDPAQAAQQFVDPAWKAASQYRAGQFAESAQTLDGLDTADTWYNKGNALARMNRFQEAIQAYTEALKRDPQHEDAKYNQELVKKQLTKPPPEESKEKPEEKDKPDHDSEEQKASSSPSENGQEPPKPNEQNQTEPSEEQQAKQDQPATPEQEAQKAEANQAEEEAKKAEEANQETAQQAQADQASKEHLEELKEEEKQLAAEQWLRRIPDDPGGLLRRKFLYQYQRQGQTRYEANPW